MANIARTPFSSGAKITFVFVSNVEATPEKIGPKDVATPGGGPTIPTSGVIWWPRK